MLDTMPAEAFPPGDFLRDELEERGWTQSEFAEIIGRPVTLVNDIIKGKRGITPGTAMELAAALGTSPMLWMNLDASYQLWKLSQTKPRPERIKTAARVRDKYPVREMITRRWIEPTEDPDVLELRVREFLHVDSLDDEPCLPFAAKKGASLENYNDLSPIQLVWLFRVHNIAGAMVVPPYSEAGLRESLDELAALTVAPDEIRHVPALLERCGVRFVVVEPFKGSKIDGVCFWLNGDPATPVIGLTLRHDRIDNFWFVLRHEIEHVLQRHAMLDSDLANRGHPDEVGVQEAQANAAAADFCVPATRLRDFITRVGPIFSEKRVVGFARLMERHPGLVVGQIQNKTGRYDLLKKYLVNVRNVLVPNALTDGYGQELPV
ncbi:MAG TPA: HigA family addiction module antitoxin, partial [Longimicrobium sp.]|nr:HigA family addiction module antitoxin [Longimicrobium sp.]